MVIFLVKILSLVGVILVLKAFFDNTLPKFIEYKDHEKVRELERRKSL